MRKYKTKSTFFGLLTRMKLNLLINPDRVNLDLEKKEITVFSGTECFRSDLSELVDVEVVYYKCCTDFILETKSRKCTIRCLGFHISGKLKSIIRSYLWTHLMRSRSLKTDVA